MPSNPLKDEMQAYTQIDRILSAVGDKGLDRDGLVHQIIMNYPISIKKIEFYIDTYYVKKGYFEENKGILKKAV